jgi:hypothetical protein
MRQKAALRIRFRRRTGWTIYINGTVPIQLFGTTTTSSRRFLIRQRAAYARRRTPLCRRTKERTRENSQTVAQRAHYSFMLINAPTHNSARGRELNLFALLAYTKGGKLHTLSRTQSAKCRVGVRERLQIAVLRLACKPTIRISGREVRCTSYNWENKLYTWNSLTVLIIFSWYSVSKLWEFNIHLVSSKLA